MDFLPLLKSLTNFNKICIDNKTFKLHYRWTFGFLLGCAGFVFFRQYVAEPIQCISDESIKEIMDTYCWIHSTSTIAVRDPVTNKYAYRALDGANDSLDSLIPESHPGIGPVLKTDTMQYHNYYQWVWCVLALQAVFFYSPHWIWKVLEGGKINSLVSDLANAHVISEDTKKRSKDDIVAYLMSNKGHHTFYSLQFLLCEVLNFANVIAQIYVTDAFLGNEFSKNGWNLLNFIESKPYARNDVLARIFPTVTACSIGRFGPSGKIVVHDALCVLPINILNEKIYICVWFWFILVATMSTVVVFHRLFLFTTPYLRLYEMRRRVRSVRKDILITISTHFDFGDWFFLTQLGENMNSITFAEILKELASELSSEVESSPKPLMTNYDNHDDKENNVSILVQD